jgi:aminodeoxyfutalosine synthase
MPTTTSAPARFRDKSLAPLWDKVRAGERLTREDGLTLFASDDLHGLGRMADHVKSARHGDRVFFVLNRYVNPTNVCVLSCAFCDFARKPGEEGAFENSIEDVLEMIKPGTREAHIVGGHHPDWPFEYFERMIAAVHAPGRRRRSRRSPPAEVDYWWRRWKIEPRESLTRLKAAGLPLDAGRRGRDLLEAARQAAALQRQGRRGSLAGDPRDRPRAGHPHQRHHALRARGDAGGAGRSPAPPPRAAGSVGRLPHLHPLAYQVGTTKLVARQTPPTDDLRTIAISRLCLDNFPHVEAYWVMIGEETASLALHFGASDVNGTLEDEKIAHMAHAESPAGLAREQILRMIRDAGKTPVERDALYNVVKVWS